jgi:hypothetical protein
MMAQPEPLTLRTRARYSGEAMPPRSSDRPRAGRGPLYRAPRGTFDVLPAEQPYWRLVRDTAERLCRAFGYQRIDTPTFEDARLFLCGGSGDADGDGLLNAWETCGWGTDPNVVDTDGDGKGDCKEAADVDGNGLVNFVGDVIYYAKAALLPAASFGKTMDFDIDKNGTVDFVGDVIQEAKFALINGLCK